MKKIDLGKNALKKQPFIRSRDNVKVLEIEKNEQYSLAYGELERLQENKKHKMAMQEIYYIIEGKGIMIVAGEKIKIKKGMIVKVEKNKEQKILTTGRRNLQFLMIVNPPYSEDKEIIFEE
ncbi:MAG: cupin domain-containing protein [Candidatus Heimdallarchaeota archaeon]|nr:cupin domain-containing protein [Candidatus Heimdallarchaeota archaeon]